LLAWMSRFVLVEEAGSLVWGSANLRGLAGCKPVNCKFVGGGLGGRLLVVWGGMGGGVVYG